MRQSVAHWRRVVRRNASETVPAEEQPPMHQRLAIVLLVFVAFATPTDHWTETGAGDTPAPWVRAAGGLARSNILSRRRCLRLRRRERSETFSEGTVRHRRGASRSGACRRRRRITPRAHGHRQRARQPAYAPRARSAPESASEAEVARSIEMGTTDAEAQAQDPTGPVTFSNLQTALSPVLPNVSVERLAEAYAEESPSS